MKLITTVAAVLLLTSTYASAWTIRGTVQKMTQAEDGSVLVSILKSADGLIVGNRVIAATDPYKKEKIAILLTAKSSNSEVLVDTTGDLVGFVSIQ